MAKISFDVKYRQQIESGEYKVITAKEQPVRIICWDRSTTYWKIIALVLAPDGKTENPFTYDVNGKESDGCLHNHELDLFIITPEPELKENEDEKIRKALICGLSEGLSEHNWQGFGGATIDECLAWLEKQKEKVSDEFDENYKIGNYHSGLILAWVNQPSTLQPAHKYHGKNVVAIHLKKGGFRCCCVDDPSPSTFEIPDGTLSPLCGKWHNEKFVEKEQQPAWWSEEDEKILNRIVFNLETHCPITPFEQINWLKNLPYRFSLSSWGEEIRDAFFGVERNWKPSDEQVDALKEASTSWMNEKMGNMKILESLYEQLRAL